MMSQSGSQKILIGILSNISQSKGNQTMKFGQFLEYKKTDIFFKGQAEDETERLVSDLFCFLK